MYKQREPGSDRSCRVAGAEREGRTMIAFYNTRGEYGCFSNFSKHGVEFDGKFWPTVEHYFQAQKFAGTDHAEAIRRAASPGKAKELGRSKAVPLRPDWEQVRDEVMFRAVLRKFETHARARKVLLSTGDEELVENAPSDGYW